MPEYRPVKNITRAAQDNDSENEYAPYRRLAAAIIIQAVRDYRRVKNNRRNKTDTYTLDEVERFFRSDWFGILTDMSGEACLNQLKSEAYKVETDKAYRYSCGNLNMSKHNK